MTRKFLGLFALVLGGLGAGCGQTSYFSVDVVMDSSVTQACLSQVVYAQVKPEGAVSDSSTFLLEHIPSSNYPSSGGQLMLGKFQYGTTSESGTVKFTITLQDGSHNTLASGSGQENIVAGGNKALSVKVVPESSCGM